MRLLILLGLFFIATPALAHKPSDSYLSLHIDGDHIQGQWDIALRDLDYAIGLDVNQDGAITWGELRVQHDAIAAYGLARLHLEADGAPCPARMLRHLVDNHTDGAYTVLEFSAICPSTAKEYTVEYGLFFDLDPQHRGLLRVVQGGHTRTAIFSPERRRQVFEVAATGPWQELLAYGREGVWHIWIGYDHVLFLLSLLLPAVLRREARDWRPVLGFRPALLDVVQIVTAFTLAHSMTLSLAAFGVITLPARLVESAIAASVAIAAVNNLYPIVDKRRWAVAFGFGLVHGLGFANVLADLGLPQDSLLLSLFGFNLGVEAGQLVIVAAFLPLAYLARNTMMYRHVALGLGSVLITALAALWFVERSFNLALAP